MESSFSGQHKPFIQLVELSLNTAVDAIGSTYIARMPVSTSHWDQSLMLIRTSIEHVTQAVFIAPPQLVEDGRFDELHSII